MQEWCFAHPWMTFFIVMSLVPSITICFRRCKCCKED